MVWEPFYTINIKLGNINLPNIVKLWVPCTQCFISINISLYLISQIAEQFKIDLVSFLCYNAN